PGREEVVVSRSADQLIRAGPGEDAVAALAAPDLVRTALAVHPVRAAEPEDAVRPGGAVQVVVLTGSGHRPGLDPDGRTGHDGQRGRGGSGPGRDSAQADGDAHGNSLEWNAPEDAVRREVDEA